MDVHRHYCRSCRVPWEHDGDQIQGASQLATAHQCPRCGTEGWVKYYGNETHDEMCELEAFLELAEKEDATCAERAQANRDFARMASRLHRPEKPDTIQLAENLEHLTQELERPS